MSASADLILLLPDNLFGEMQRSALYAAGRKIGRDQTKPPYVWPTRRTVIECLAEELGLPKDELSWLLVNTHKDGLLMLLAGVLRLKNRVHGETATSGA